MARAVHRTSSCHKAAMLQAYKAARCAKHSFLGRSQVQKLSFNLRSSSHSRAGQSVSALRLRKRRLSCAFRPFTLDCTQLHSYS